MCVIIVKPEGANLRRDDFRKLWKTNPDGGGMSVISPRSGKLISHKSTNPARIWQVWRGLQANFGNPLMVMHLRIATHGVVDASNCHPFTAGNDTATVVHHNGIVTCTTPAKGDSRSDTRIFAEDLLRDFSPQWLDNPRLVEAVEDIGGWSKFAFHTANPTLTLPLYLLGTGWVDHRGLKLSNDYGLKARYYFPKGNVQQPQPVAATTARDDFDMWKAEWDDHKRWYDTDTDTDDDTDTYNYRDLPAKLRDHYDREDQNGWWKW